MAANFKGYYTEYCPSILIFKLEIELSQAPLKIP